MRGRGKPFRRLRRRLQRSGLLCLCLLLLRRARLGWGAIPCRRRGRLRARHGRLGAGHHGRGGRSALRSRGRPSPSSPHGPWVRSWAVAIKVNTWKSALAAHMWRTLVAKYASSSSGFCRATTSFHSSAPSLALRVSSVGRAESSAAFCARYWSSVSRFASSSSSFSRARRASLLCTSAAAAGASSPPEAGGAAHGSSTGAATPQLSSAGAAAASVAASVAAASSTFSSTAPSSPPQDWWTFLSESLRRNV